MTWLTETLDRLSGMLPCGYYRGGPLATEPTALASLALTIHDRAPDAAPGLTWLAELQSQDGSIGVTSTEASPCWPTCLATLAWLSYASKFGETNADADYRGSVGRAIGWILETKGKALPRMPELGHNSMLIGWPWVVTTHSWMEPTAWAVLALKAAGRGDHARTREGVRLLDDRLLPRGGCNYGNTTVLGQELLPHLQASGLAMVALAGETAYDGDGKIARTLDYLEQQLNDRTTTASLCYGLLGLGAHGRSVAKADEWLAASYDQATRRDAAGLKLALLALAAARDKSPSILRARV
jgi:hypothetical protein